MPSLYKVRTYDIVTNHRWCVTLQALIYRAVFIEASHTLRLLMCQLRKV
jgi:hypothetical protein